MSDLDIGLRSAETMQKHPILHAIPEERTKKSRILLVDDDLFIAEFLHEFFTDFEVGLDVTEDPDSAMNLVNRNDYAMVLVDVTLGAKDGTILARKLEKTESAPPVVLFTGMSKEWIEEKVCCENYLQKPFRVNELVELMNRFDIIDIDRVDI